MLYIRKFLLLTLACALIVIGLLGMVLPIIHGTVFLLLGAIIFSFESVYLEKKILYLVKKNESLHQLYIKIDSTLRRWFNKHREY